MSTLNLNGNYAEQMLSMYLWGQLTPPNPSEIADDKWIRPSDATTTVNIDAQSYMATAGSHLSIAKQRCFNYFLIMNIATKRKINQKKYL